ncbi:PREDICTED: red-sensitive opsin-like [Amphimedon queenslandica]|uniref:G-protein coupled receptors family 1 profile domain-containing protein n=1 Tax=Amphimedon queenslandica TaxID=400682 RepID=A0A1X7VIA7_AMPQE|nr:PREDICTED: red-sensitive opsin-like [Amphimedon queenslandica]|eukprot:XP_011410233.1 PREDICTED: red-sensitive opsin-like [Amphimedon queenslandica]
MDGVNYTLSEDINGPLLAAVLTLQMIGALVANGIVLIATLSQYKSLKLPSTILFTSLIIMHLVMALLYIPSWILSAASGGWIFGRTMQVKEGTCKFAGFILWYIILVIYMTLAAISVDRWLFIVKPQLYKQFMKPKVALTIIASIWILAALINSTPFYGIGRFRYAIYGSCVPTFEEQFVYVVLMMAIFLAISAVILVTSVWTYIFTKKFIQEHSELEESSVYVSRKRRLIGIFGVMLIAYFVCFSPGYIFGFLSQIYDLHDLSYAIALVFFMMITIINPIIQSYFRPDVKKAFVKLKIKCLNI